MKRVIIFLTLFIAGMGMCLAADYNTVILPSSYLKKSDTCVLYSKNLEEIFANNLIKNFASTKKFTSPSTSTIKHALSSNPQLNSVLDRDEKVKILAKIYGANRVIDVTIKYEIKSLNTTQNSKMLEKVALINDNTYLRIITKVNIINISDNKIIWSNVYCKNLNFETLDNKHFSPITNYFEKLSQNVVDETKTQSCIKPVANKQQDSIEPQNLPDTTVEIHNDPSKFNTPKKTNITPQLQVQEDLTEKNSVQIKQPKQKKVSASKKQSSQKETKPVKTKSTDGFGSKLKNIQLKLKPSTPNKEIKPEDIKTDKKPQTIQPTYTNIHVSPRKNSRDYTPKFDNSVNDI